MASRSKQKEEARARRLAAEQARQDRSRQQRRLQMLIVAGLAAAAVVAVAVVIGTSGGGSKLKTGTQATQLGNQVSQLLSGIPQSGARLGNPSAPVTMVYYGDLECPVCADFSLKGGLPDLISKDVRSGKVQLVFRAFQTATRDQSTFRTQQVAALAAGKQSHFWDFVELFYRQQGAEGTGYVTDAYLNGLARQIPGLDLSKWQSERTDPALVDQLVADGRDAASIGVRGTPTLVMQGPKGKSQVPQTVPTYNQLQQAVNEVA